MKANTAGTTVTDSWTLEIAAKLQSQLAGILGAKPYFVIAQFDRLYLDVNAEVATAYSDPNAAPYYNAYHQTLEAFVEDARARFSKGVLLLDIHGHNRAGLRNVIIRGTRDGRTVQNLRNRYGDEVITGKLSLFGRLVARGYQVQPPIGSAFGNPGEVLNGGEIVERHGTINPNGIDAIQIEIGRELRDTHGERVRLIGNLAQVLSEFHKAYLR